MLPDIGAALGGLLRRGARRIAALEGGGRVVPAHLPRPGDGEGAQEADLGFAAQEPTADPGGWWWPWGAQHADPGVDEGDDDEQPERDELRRTRMM